MSGKYSDISPCSFSLDDGNETHNSADYGAVGNIISPCLIRRYTRLHDAIRQSWDVVPHNYFTHLNLVHLRIDRQIKHTLYY